MLSLFTKMGLKNGTQNASFHFKSKCNLQYMIFDTPLNSLIDSTMNPNVKTTEW
jgi:hypothetical protein